VIVEVSDTGKGVDPEHRDKIFEPFVTTKPVGVGSGLGLSICKKLIEDFAGTISFVSEPEKGTTFRISLPRVPSDWAGGEEQPDARPMRSSLRGRILVVDDEEGMRSAIVRMLKRHHDVSTVVTGKEGRALLARDKRFDIIFCDLMMPEMSGMDLHAWLAAEDARLAEQIVFITGGAFTPGASAYLARVGNQCIEKPLDPTSFKKMTDELVLAARSKLGT
jgi:CheY-like chemotaxis protein